MVPDKFVRVDLHGIDVLESQGEEIPGLYDELVESIQLCRYQIVYNWKFNGILISPTYVEMRLTEDGVKINSYITVTSEDIIHIYSIESEPVINPLTVTENGEYLAPEGVDGFSPVNVNVPDTPPVVEGLNVVANGIYYPSEGVDGFSPVNVNVPDTPPVVEGLNVVANGIYYPPEGVDGFSSATVNVEPPSISIPEIYSYSGGGGSHTISLQPNRYAVVLFLTREAATISLDNPYYTEDIGSGLQPNQFIKCFSVNTSIVNSITIIEDSQRSGVWIFYVDKQVEWIPTSIHFSSTGNKYIIPSLKGQYVLCIYNSYTNEYLSMTFSVPPLYASTNTALRFASAIFSSPVLTDLDVSLGATVSEESNSNYIFLFKEE